LESLIAQLLLLLAILLFTAKLGGYISTLLHQPSVLGEIIAGLIIGPSLINLLNTSYFHDPFLEEMVHFLAEMGVILLMFVAGLELHFSELIKNSKVSALVGILGVIFPIILGWGVGLIFNFDQEHAIYLGMTLAATSVSISAQTLMELKKIRTRVGLGLLGAAIFDDVLVILILSAFLALAGGGSNIGTVILLFLRMVAFLALSTLFGLWVLPKIVHRVSPLPISQGVLTLALIVTLVYGFAALVLGSMAAITGAFLAGLMFSRSPEKEPLERGISALAYGFFVPIFFVNIGLTVNVRQVDLQVFWMIILVSLAAIIGKLLGGGLGARLAGYTTHESVQVGAGMVSRGEVGLILASVGLNEGLVDSDLFTVIVAMVIITTLITPPMLRFLFKEKKPRLKSQTQPELEMEE